METFDTLRPNDKVTVTIWGPGDENLYKSTESGFHNLESAINQAIDNANLTISPEDCVFEVTNEDKGVTHKYRFNAHGHLKLII